jgi:replicative DNA helicase
LKQYSSGFIKFKSKNTNLDPYFVGLWLGDGTVGEAHITNQDDQVIEFVEQYAEKLNMRCNKTSYSKTRIQRLAIVSKKLRSHEKNIVKDTLMKDHYINGEKRISSMYLLNTKQVRLDVLAGLIDTDGYLSKFACAQIMTKYDGLKEDILFLARSLGFAAYASKLTKTIKSLNFSGEYWAVNISGDLSEVPCKITYKKAKPRKQIKNVLRTGITVKSIGQGEYFGFAVDGDHLFLLKNFTVVHNSTFTLQIADSVRGTGNISLLNTCEESLYQVRKTITRLGLKNGFIPSYKSEAHDLIEHAEKVRLAHPGKQMFLFVDSLQTIEFDTKKGGRPMERLAESSTTIDAKVVDAWRDHQILTSTVPR